MDQRPIDTLTPGAIYTELYFRETRLANASAFLWREKDSVYLISNWHNFAGRDPESEKTISDTGGIPDRVQCTLWKHEEPGGKPSVGDIVNWKTYSFPLVDDHLTPLFLENPLRKRGVDIAALPLNLPSEVVATYVNEVEFSKMPLRAGTDVFIVGYPLGLLFDAPFPVWKRGSIASEPNAPIHGLKKVLIDTATRPGMSGSFVIAQDIIAFGARRAFLGIYSGRYVGSHEQDAQLGIAWHRDAIDETVRNGVRASV